MDTKQDMHGFIGLQGSIDGVEMGKWIFLFNDEDSKNASPLRACIGFKGPASEHCRYTLYLKYIKVSSRREEIMTIFKVPSLE